MDIAIPKASSLVRSTASCGSRSTDRKAAMRSILSTREKTTVVPRRLLGSITAAPKIHESTHKAGMEQPVWHWTPSIAPSGLAIYTGDLFPSWKGNLFNGALKFQLLSRLEIKDGKVVKEERLLQGLNERIRDVRQGPDGALYLLTDNSAGRILRVAPAK